MANSISCINTHKKERTISFALFIVELNISFREAGCWEWYTFCLPYEFVLFCVKGNSVHSLCALHIQALDKKRTYIRANSSSVSEGIWTKKKRKRKRNLSYLIMFTHFHTYSHIMYNFRAIVLHTSHTMSKMAAAMALRCRIWYSIRCVENHFFLLLLQ